MNWRAVVDDALEASVVASFSNVGYIVRRRLHRWQAPPADALAGRTVLITGPTSGIGLAAARGLAGLGARLLLVSRSADRLAALRDELAAHYGEERFAAYPADMSSLDSVRGLIERIHRDEPRLDVIVDNAGAIFAKRELSPDGIELTLATFVVGPFALIDGVLPLLRQGNGGRVVTVTSGGMYAQSLQLDDLQFEEGEYNGTMAYARAKRAQVVLAREWARRLAGSGVTFNAMHPGWVDTPGLADSLPGFYGLMRPLLRTVAQGADTIVWLAEDPAATRFNGRLFLDRRPRPFDRLPGTRTSPDERVRLWEALAELAGVAPAASTRKTATDRSDLG